MGDVLDGFKNFVVKFMIRMSRVSYFNHVFTALLSFLPAAHVIYVPRVCHEITGVYLKFESLKICVSRTLLRHLCKEK